MKIWEYLDEVLAVVIVVGCLVLMGLHIDSDVKAILSMAAAWVFGKRMGIAQSKTNGE
jgi:hypothetical protein